LELSLYSDENPSSLDAHWIVGGVCARLLQVRQSKKVIKYICFITQINKTFCKISKNIYASYILYGNRLKICLSYFFAYFWVLKLANK
jgi:hypothetical protein